MSESQTHKPGEPSGLLTRDKVKGKSGKSCQSPTQPRNERKSPRCKRKGNDSTGEGGTCDVYEQDCQPRSGGPEPFKDEPSKYCSHTAQSGAECHCREAHAGTGL